MAGPAGAAEPDVATTKAVLRRADITAGCAAAGLPDPGPVASGRRPRRRPRPLRTAKRSARRHLDVRCR